MLRPILMGRICVIFGVVLALLFAGASSSNMLDRVQHAPSVASDHEHVLFSGLTAESDHSDDHRSSDDDESDTGRVPQGHHHHHGDAGSAIPLDASDRSSIAPVRSHPHDVGPTGERPGSNAAGLERPPRGMTMNA